MNKQAEEVLAQLKQRLRSHLPSHVVSVICFGSYRRGEETPESDLDVLVVVTNQDRSICDLIRERACAVMCNHDFDPPLSVKIISEKEWKRRERPKTSFYEHLQQQGITI